MTSWFLILGELLNLHNFSHFLTFEMRIIITSALEDGCEDLLVERTHVKLLAQGLAHRKHSKSDVPPCGIVKPFSPTCAGQGKGWGVRMQP